MPDLDSWAIDHPGPQATHGKLQRPDVRYIKYHLLIEKPSLQF